MSSSNAMSHVMSYIYANIPSEILELAFNARDNMTTIDALIEMEVITGRVLMDTNLITGRRKNIPLRDDWKLTLENPNGWYTGLITDAAVYQIPPEAREHKAIIAVDRIVFSTQVTAQGMNYPTVQGLEYGNTATGLMREVLNSRTMAQQPIIPVPHMLNSSMIKITPNIWTESLVLQCRIAFDEKFTNMDVNLIKPLREMALHAVRAYIYNKLVVKIDVNEMVNGVAIGRVKEIIDAYSDANALYLEALTGFQGNTFMATENLAEYLRYMI